MITAPDGRPVELPCDVGPDDPFGQLSPSDARSHYLEWGYVVVRGLVPEDRCSAAIKELPAIKEIADPLERFQSDGSAPHRFDEKRHIRNAVRGVHRLKDPLARPFVDACRDILGEPKIAMWADQLAGEPMVMSDSFYFEVTSATEPHQDLAYDLSLRKMVASWVALETIRIEAGRLYLYAGSQSFLADGCEGGHFGKEEAVRRYNDAVRDAVAEGAWPLHAPAVERGDVIFFNSALVHGALPPSGPDLTRHSLTAHWIPVGFASRIPE